MKANFYTMTFFNDSVVPFVRVGMPLTMFNSIATINGLGKYRVFRRPEVVEDLNNIEEIFKDYSNNAPWFGKEADEIMYLYRAEIDDYSLNFVECNDKYKYVYIKSKENERVSVLNGKIFFRNFIDDEQTALVRCEETTVIRIEKEEGLVMVELVDGKFICR